MSNEDENDESCILSLFTKRIYHTLRMVVRMAMRMMNSAYSYCFLLDFEDGDEDEDDNHNNNNDDDKVNVNQAYSHCLHR